MPLLSYHSALPLDFWDLIRSLFDTMTGIVWYLTAFVASTSLFQPMVSAQYLLGLGAFTSMQSTNEGSCFMDCRHWRYHWVGGSFMYSSGDIG